ncbi:hypothetical protein PI125_g17147 [Phytophthora idaei]|nr:hypothetical protein PI125_g17147 [Phytophthora idaei]
MSTHGWSSEGQGDGTGEGAGSWTPPFETETLDPAEIREEGEEARTKGYHSRRSEGESFG